MADKKKSTNVLDFIRNEIKNILFYFLIICICTDIGGLILGKTFKGKKVLKQNFSKLVLELKKIS